MTKADGMRKSLPFLVMVEIGHNFFIKHVLCCEIGNFITCTYEMFVILLSDTQSTGEEQSNRHSSWLSDRTDNLTT